MALLLVLGFAVGLGLLPLVLGLLLASPLRRLDAPRRGAASGLAFGALLFLFGDFFTLSGNLGAGVADLAWRATLAGTFGLALAGLTAAGAHAAPLRRAALWMVGVGLHGLGEGIIAGYNLTLGLAEAWNAPALLSFGLHKLAEGAVAAVLLAGAGGPALDGPKLAGLALIGSLPLAAGGLLGLQRVPAALANPAFAFGAGAVAYALALTAAGHGQAPRAWAVAAALGYLVMVAFGLLHEL